MFHSERKEMVLISLRYIGVIFEKYSLSYLNSNSRANLFHYGEHLRQVKPNAVSDYKMNWEKYQNILGKRQLPNASRVTPTEWIFQQDNANIHVSLSTKAWLQGNSIQILEWTFKSPQLNPMKNLWRILLQHIYKDLQQ